MLFDSGTSVARLAAAVPPGTLGTVVTNSLPVAAQLVAGSAGTQVHPLGGRVRGITQATVGGETVAALGPFVAAGGLLLALGFRAFRTGSPECPATRRGSLASCSD